MEENNRKGPGVFYAVVGVATLVVAIIGATFAYFSAQATTTGDRIEGQTNEIKGSNLTLAVTKINFDPQNELAATNNLVPAVITDDSISGVNAALEAKCINQGYTGCHVYRLAITSDQTISEANLLLDISVTRNSGNWKYLVVSGDETAAVDHDATEITTPATVIKTTGITAADYTDDVDLHSRTVSGNKTVAGLTANQTQYYYLVVYLKNIDAAQNDASDPIGEGNTYEYGTYTGQVVLQAMGGQVKATFGNGA